MAPGLNFITSHFKKVKSKKPGLSPGTLIFVGSKKLEATKIEVVDFTKEKIEETEIENPEDCVKYKTSQSTTWINITGLHDTQVIEKICNNYGIHPLIQEDIVNTQQRPKLEDMVEHLVVSLKMIYYDEQNKGIAFEHITVILGKNFVMTFQESEGDVFDNIRKRLRNGKGRIRGKADYLAYAIIDAVVDNYSVVLEKVSEAMDYLEDEIANPKHNTQESIRRLKKEIIFLRKNIVPLKEVIRSFERSESKLINQETSIYFRDVYDHVVEVIETTETYREILGGIMESYHSGISNKANEVMKVLTIIATIFIPLTFIVGIYGMNFKYMPELEWQNGYFFVWGIMIVVAGIMTLYFKKKKWL